MAMPSLKAILILLAAGGGSFFWANGMFAAHAIAAGHTIGASRMAAANPQEDQKSLAHKAIAEGKLLEMEGSAPSLRKALARYQQALPIWRALADRRSEAGTLQYIGIVHYRLDERKKALEVFQQELQIWQSLADGQKQ